VQDIYFGINRFHIYDMSIVNNSVSRVLYLIHRYFVFVTNESDVRTTELRTE